eukprot:Pgem_evm1s13979
MIIEEDILTPISPITSAADPSTASIKKKIQNNYIVYVLTNSCNKRTYLGVTNNSIRRLRQHNGELKGGARSTKMAK